MSLIKASDKVQVLGVKQLFNGNEKQSIVKSKADPYAEEIARLKALISAYEAERPKHDIALKKAFDDGVAEGRLEREAEFEYDQTAALERLEQGLTTAQSTLTSSLNDMEALSVLVAQSVLNKIFGEEDNRHHIVIDLIKHQFVQLKGQMAVSVDVSRTDFLNSNDVKALAEHIGIEADKVRVLDTLDAGDCQIKLALGTLDLGLSQQWNQIRDVLDSFINTKEMKAKGGQP